MVYIFLQNMGCVITGMGTCTILFIVLVTKHTEVKELICKKLVHYLILILASGYSYTIDHTHV